MIVFSSLEELPAEAAHDKEVARHLGIKSNLTFPLTAGGSGSIGALAFSTILEERTWPEQIIQGLQLFAQMLINALVRKQSDEACGRAKDG